MSRHSPKPWYVGGFGWPTTAPDTAAECKRLRAINAQLLAACEQTADTLERCLCPDGSWTDCPASHKRALLNLNQAAIAKAQEK